MKLRLLVFIGLMTNLLVSAQAQTSSNDVAFVDEQGNVIKSNTTIVLNKAETSDANPDEKKIAGKVYIQNVSDKDQNVTLSYTINSIEEGSVQVCALGNCTFNDELGTYTVNSKLLAVGSQKEFIDIEHLYGESEKCEVTLKLTSKKSGIEEEKDGPSITIKFDVNAAGIASVASQKGVSFDVYNTQGVLLHKQLTSLSNLPKGIYIVKQKGIASTKKYVVR
mgnify:FL=1